MFMKNNILLLVYLQWKHNQNRFCKTGREGIKKVKLKFPKLYLRFRYAENLFAGNPESGLQSDKVQRSGLCAPELDHDYN